VTQKILSFKFGVILTHLDKILPLVTNSIIYVSL